MRNSHYQGSFPKGRLFSFGELMADVYHAQRRIAERPDARIAGKQLILKTIAIGKERASVLVPDCIKVEDLTRRAVVENGGLIGRVYNKQFSKHEMVAIKIGNEVLAKEKLDFENIEWEGKIDEQSLDKIKEASEKSKGGLHFFIGEKGVPVVIRKKGLGDDLIFPSGDEAGTEGISEFRYATVNSKVDPKTAEEFRRASRKEIMEGCHASAREKEIEVKGDELQVGDIETGEIKPINEYRKIESFVYDDINLENVMKHELKFVDNRVTPVLFHNEAVHFKCEFSYLHIKIIESKEDIFDHVEFIANASEIEAASSPVVVPEMTVQGMPAVDDYSPAPASIPCKTPILEIGPVPVKIPETLDKPKPEKHNAQQLSSEKPGNEIHYKRYKRDNHDRLDNLLVGDVYFKKPVAVKYRKGKKIYSGNNEIKGEREPGSNVQKLNHRIKKASFSDKIASESKKKDKKNHKKANAGNKIRGRAGNKNPRLSDPVNLFKFLLIRLNKGAHRNNSKKDNSGRLDRNLRNPGKNRVRNLVDDKNGDKRKNSFEKGEVNPWKKKRSSRRCGRDVRTAHQEFSKLKEDINPIVDNTQQKDRKKSPKKKHGKKNQRGRLRISESNDFLLFKDRSAAEYYSQKFHRKRSYE